jgi:cell division protein FtsN
MKKPQPYNRKKRFIVELSRTQLFLSIMGVLFVLTWAFILGIFVGRGYVPDSITQTIQNQFRKLQSGKKALTDKYLAQEKKAEIPQEEVVNPRLEFFNKKQSAKGNETVQLTVPQPTPKPQEEKEIKKETPQPIQATKVPAEKTETPNGANGILIQIGSYREETSALSSIKRLQEKGYQPLLQTKELPQKGGRWFRVQLGPFKTKSEAQALIKKLERDGFQAVLLEKNN